MASGGKRAGAGRKTTRDRFARPVARAEKQIADRLPSLVDHLFELAEGVRVQETGFDGLPRVYTRPPCFKSLSYLVDRILGKPTQAIEAEVAGPGGGPIPVEQSVRPDAVTAIKKAFGIADDSDGAARAAPAEEPAG